MSYLDDRVRGRVHNMRSNPLTDKELPVKKADLLIWLDHEIENWESFLTEFGRDRLEQPDVNGPWSMKDVIAHLTGWTHRLVARMRAALSGLPDPATAWPAHLKSDDEINAWIYATHKDQALAEVLADCRETLRQLRAVVEAFSEDTAINDHYRQVQLGGHRFAVGEFFDHFHDDHEPGIRAWMARNRAEAGR